MKLMRRLRKHGGEGSPGRAYEQSLSTPFHHLVTILLSRAVEEGADAICFGFRPDIVESAESREARRKSAEEFSSWLAAQRLIHPSPFIALENSAMTRGPIGQMGVPICFRTCGVIKYFGDQPFHSYGMLLETIQYRPVALGASEDKPQPLRYIEIGYEMSKYPVTSSHSGKRRFVEVDLEIQQDNTFWVHIRSVREVSPEVRVSQTIG